MPDALDGHVAVWGLLDAVTGVAAYDGEIVNAQGKPINPPTDQYGRAEAYAVLYFSPGRRYASALAGAQTSLDTTFQVTCAAGDPTRALWCAGKVSAALVGTTVELDGAARQIRAVEDDPGTVRRDDNVTPARHYIPLRFRLHAP